MKQLLVEDSMSDVSLLRLYVLRATYALLLVGLGSTIWPRIISHPLEWGLMNSVVACLLTALSLLSVFGIKYPLMMLPILVFELVWKLVWLLAVALPLWRAGRIDAQTLQSVWECLPGIIILPLVIPWPYFLANYVKKPGDRWK